MTDQCRVSHDGFPPWMRNDMGGEMIQLLGPPVFPSMVVSGSPKRWDRWHSPSPNWQVCHTTYIPGIVLAEPRGLYVQGRSTPIISIFFGDGKVNPSP